MSDPVLIIGAGPVGLSLAVALISKGVRVQVFEALPELSHEARASTFHPATMEMFAEWGVIDPVLAPGYRVDSLQYWERQTRELVADLDYRLIAGDTPYPFRLQLPQSHLTRVLKPILDASPLADVFMSHTLDSFADCGTHVEAMFNTPDGTRTFKGAYLCGADGAHSTVRRGLGMRFEGVTYEDRFLLIASDLDLRTSFAGIGPVAYLFDPDEWVIILHLPDVRRIVFRVQDHEDEHAIQQIDAVRQRIANFIRIDEPFQILGTSVYKVHQRIADQFRVGRVVLLGDAAHINNPIGGMGMNSGIHDAEMLARSLLAGLRGASDSDLDEYAAARKAAAVEDVQRRSDQNYKDMVAAAAAREARNRQMREMAADPKEARAYLLKASMLEHRI